MPTIQELESALIEADKAGNVEDAQILADEIRRLRTAAQPKLSAPQRFAYGAQEPVTGLAQMLYESVPESVQQAGTQIDRALYDLTGGIVGKQQPFGEAVQAQEQWYQQRVPEGFDVARLAGNIATGVLATRGMGTPQSALGATAQGAAVGGGIGAATPVYGDAPYWQEKAGQVGGGGAFGAALGPAGYAFGRAIQPKPKPDVEALRAMGVQPTVGASIGPTAGRIEQMGTSIPFFGDAIARARGMARDQFNKAVMNQALAPIGKKVDKIGTDGIAKAQEYASQAYKNARNLIPGMRLDTRAKAEIANLSNAAKNMKPDEAARFERYIKNEFPARFRQGGITSETFKRVDSELGDLATKYQREELGGAFRQLNEIIKQQAARISPEYADALRRADQTYANLVILENAVNRASGKEGIFTPNQLLQAAKSTDKSVRRRASAAGGRPFQDIAQKASRVIGDTYPESGTAGRTMAGLVGGSVVLDPMTTALAAGGLYGAGRALYSPTGQRALTYLTEQTPYAISNQVSRGLPLLTPGLLGQYQ